MGLTGCHRISWDSICNPKMPAGTERLLSQFATQAVGFSPRPLYSPVGGPQSSFRPPHVRVQVLDLQEHILRLLLRFLCPMGEVLSASPQIRRYFVVFGHAQEQDACRQVGDVSTQVDFFTYTASQKLLSWLRLRWTGRQRSGARRRREPRRSHLRQCWWRGRPPAPDCARSAARPGPAG